MKTGLKIVCNLEGQRSSAIPPFNRVKQGCILTSLLFKYCINVLVLAVSQQDLQLPKIVPLYTEDTVLLPQLFIGLKRVLHA